MPNLDARTVAGFGEEWARFDQTAVDEAELREAFERYFAIFPWHRLPPDAVGFDAGCGSGRWARFVAPLVGRLHCVDASAKALATARRNLRAVARCEFYHCSVDSMPFPDASMDFGYSIGVLHHVPDTGAAIRSCVTKLKPGAPLLLYLYYAFDNRPAWYRCVWKASDVVRRGVSRLPAALRVAMAEMIAATVYWPLARASTLAERVGIDVTHLPLSFYRRHSLYTMRTDALDRFGTRLEQRFTAAQIRAMMGRAGLGDIRLHSGEPFWCAVGIRTR